MLSRPETIQQRKNPLQCWGFGELHYFKNFSHRACTKKVTNLQEASIVGDDVKNIPWINAALDDGQDEYRPMMIELEGKLSKYYVSILIYPSAILSYISPKLVELSNLPKVKFKNP